MSTQKHTIMEGDLFTSSFVTRRDLLWHHLAIPPNHHIKRRGGVLRKTLWLIMLLMLCNSDAIWCLQNKIILGFNTKWSEISLSFKNQGSHPTAIRLWYQGTIYPDDVHNTYILLSRVIYLYVSCIFVGNTVEYILAWIGSTRWYSRRTLHFISHGAYKLPLNRTLRYPSLRSS